MPWSSWPNYAFEHKLCLIGWPMDARPPDGAYYNFKDASNDLKQVQINLSNQMHSVDHLDEDAIQIVSWEEACNDVFYVTEDMEHEIDDPDLREDSAKFIDELAESKGLSITMLKKQKGAPKKKVKRNNAILPCNLYNYPDDPNHAKSSKA
ncbi:hypothetical protein DXG01_008781 [Tephrocybe rancida]|nr:hypothetical protein DXG01_008781 [Tephrocybe rancida]